MNRKGLIASCLVLLGMTGCAGRVYTSSYYEPEPLYEPGPVVVNRTVHVDVDIHRRHHHGYYRHRPYTPRPTTVVVTPPRPRPVPGTTVVVTPPVRPDRHDNGRRAHGPSQADIDRRRDRRDLIRDQKEAKRELVREHRDERRAEKSEASAR